MKAAAAIVLLMMAMMVALACTDTSEVAEPRRSTVGVEAAGCSLVSSWGTGVVVADEATVVTAAHTVAGATTITVHDVDGDAHQAELRAIDPASDLAVLHVASLDARPLPIARAEMASDATLFRWDLQAEPKVLATAEVRTVKRLDVTIDDIYREQEVQRDAFELSGSIVTGDSGGPVVSDAGEVWGIVYAASRARPSVGFAVNASEIDAVLEATADAQIAAGVCV